MPLNAEPRGWMHSMIEEIDGKAARESRRRDAMRELAATEAAFQARYKRANELAAERNAKVAKINTDVYLARKEDKPAFAKISIQKLLLHWWRPPALRGLLSLHGWQSCRPRALWAGERPHTDAAQRKKAQS